MSKDKEIRVVVRAGSFINNPGWIHTREEELNLLKRGDWTRHFQPGSVTANLAKHVREHLADEESVRAARIRNGNVRRAARILARKIDRETLDKYRKGE